MKKFVFIALIGINFSAMTMENLNAQDKIGMTSLSRAAASGDLKEVNSLLQQGANPSIPDNDNLTALTWAVRGFGALKQDVVDKYKKEYEDIVEALLAKQASPDIVSNHEYTPLTYAIGLGNINMVKMMAKSSTDLSTPLETAEGRSKKYNTDAVYADIHSFLKEQQQLNLGLLDAANENNLEKMKLQISSGANVNATDSYGYTPLMIASDRGQLGEVETLIKHGANPNQASKFNYGANTALMLASRNGHLEIVKALLKAGANVSLVDKHKQTALMLAEEKGHTQIAELLLIPSLEQLRDAQPQTEYFASGLNALIQELAKPEEESWSMCKKVGGVMLCGAALAAALKYGVSQS